MKKQNLGWIGTGVMGRWMCRHLLDAGHQMFVYSRTRDKASDLIEHGAVWCESARQTAERSDIIFSIVGFPQDVEAVILGEHGALAGTRKNNIIVDMTTSSPDLAQKIAEAAGIKGVGALDAPVSGGDVGAREATLAIMVGGDSGIYDRVLPLFEIMGKNIALMGPAGMGQHTKMANQISIASGMIGVVEALLYAHKAGLDLNHVIDVIGKGAAGSWSLNNLGRRIANKNFDPGFFIKHFVKDMGVALDEAHRMKIALPGLSLANQFYIAAMAQGFENLGTHGLYLVIQKINEK
ncbi:MAG: NAD(P)-dependent oxidoreductase [Desulfobacteraceae bacterium]|nr:NAD(P)-dependent oxidoreductase [Desulfobacteraceae bacterium]